MDGMNKTQTRPSEAFIREVRTRIEHLETKVAALQNTAARLQQEADDATADAEWASGIAGEYRQILGDDHE